MAGSLSLPAVSSFERDGVFFPVQVLSRDEAGLHLNRLEMIEQGRAGRIPPSQNVKVHLLLPWLWNLVHDRRVLDPVESLLGPDILCWASNFFIKQAGDSQHVPWHQDTTYWSLTEARALTAWIAFSDSTVANGCLRVARGTHTVQLAHVETDDAASMLPFRERLVADVDVARIANVELSAGEMSLHHGRLVHGSAPNGGGSRRVGLAIRYIAADVRQMAGMRGTATLVRGRDHGHFDLEAEPTGDFDQAAMGRYRSVLRRWMSIVTTAAGNNRARTGQ